MAINNESGLKGQTFITRLKARLRVVRDITLKSVAIGLISGSLLGILFGCAYGAFLWTGVIGAGLGLGLWLLNGLLLIGITCLFFYPLKYARLYRAIVKVIGASLAGGGVAIFGPWYFSSTSMTPSSAVFIGFSSVLASAIAGCAGALGGQDISQCYEQKSAEGKGELTARKTSRNTIISNKANRHLETILSSIDVGWMYLALLSFLCSLLGNRLLQYLICGTQDVVFCLP